MCVSSHQWVCHGVNAGASPMDYLLCWAAFEAVLFQSPFFFRNTKPEIPIWSAICDTFLRPKMRKRPFCWWKRRNFQVPHAHLCSISSFGILILRTDFPDATKSGLLISQGGLTKLPTVKPSSQSATWSNLGRLEALLIPTAMVLCQQDAGGPSVELLDSGLWFYLEKCL